MGLKCKTAYILVYIQTYLHYRNIIKAEARKIIALFIEEGSRYEVNDLSCETKEELRKKKNLGNSNLFERAKHEIANLLQSDPIFGKRLQCINLEFKKNQELF